VEWLQSRHISVEGGKRMVFFVQLFMNLPNALPLRGMSLQVRWFNQQANYISEVQGPVTPEGLISNVDLPVWPTLSMFVRAPATAHWAELRLVNYHLQNYVTRGDWNFTRIFFGEAAEGQISLPPWRA
jgi:hypothetical protein